MWLSEMVYETMIHAEVIDKANKIWEYLEAKTNPTEALRILRKLNFNDGLVLNQYSLDELITTVDKLLLAEKTIKESDLKNRGKIS